MIAKIAYLTSPAPSRYILNFQVEGTDAIERLEITEGHLANIIVDGASFALRKSNRVPPIPTESATNERSPAGT